MKPPTIGGKSFRESGNEMNKMLLAIAGVLIALAGACADATPAPTASTIPQVSTPTPMVNQEWVLEGVEANGSTVTVKVRVFAGIDVGVTLRGTAPSRVVASIPIIEFVFEDVPAGDHPVVILDVVGFSERASVTVEAPESGTGGLPDWLAEWVADLEAGNVEFPPQSITEYRYGGEIVYYVLPQCCDQFSDLLDAEGNLVGHPDGGITGRGDGVTPFPASDLKGEEIWPGR